MLRPITLLFDGNCDFCRRSLTLLLRFDVLRNIELVNANERQLVVRRFPNLVDADFDNAMFAVDPDGRIYRGFYAFRAALWSSPLLVPMAWIWHIPGIPLLGIRIYAWIARNRHSLGCASACTLDR